MWLIVYLNDHAPLTVRPIYSSSKLRTAQMMIFSLVDDRIGKMLHNICMSAVAMSLRWANRGPWASCHYFSLGRRWGRRHCGLSIFLPNSEVLADTVQKKTLSLLIEFPIEQVIREITVFDITYLSSYRKGWGVRYPDLGSLPPPPPPPLETANSDLKSFLILIIFNLKF